MQQCSIAVNGSDAADDRAAEAGSSAIDDNAVVNLHAPQLRTINLKKLYSAHLAYLIKCLC